MNANDCITCTSLIDHLEHTGISKDIPDMFCDFKHVYTQNVYFPTGALQHVAGEYESNCRKRSENPSIKSLKQPNIHKLIQLLVTKYKMCICVSARTISISIHQLNDALQIDWRYIKRLDMYSNIEWALDKYFDEYMCLLH